MSIGFRTVEATAILHFTALERATMSSAYSPAIPPQTVRYKTLEEDGLNIASPMLPLRNGWLIIQL
jgi:hypothetical protein